MNCRVKPGNDVPGNGRRDNDLIIRHIVLMRQFRPLRAAGRGYGDKICGGGELRVEIGVDRIEDSSPCIARNHCVVSCCRFQNRSRVHTLRSQIPRAMETGMPGNRNILFLIIGALIVAVGVLGFSLYQTKKQPEGLQINVGPNGLKIQNK
jgi:hypothetical protein